MKKRILTIIVMVIVMLFPAIVNAEDGTENTTRYQENRESVFNAFSRVRDYVQERRDARESSPALVEPQVIVESESNEISVDTSISYEKELENVEISSKADVNATLTNNNGLLKDSSGSINTDVVTMVTFKDEDLLSFSQLNIMDSQTNSLSYGLNDQKFSISGDNSNIFATGYNYERVNILGKLSKYVNTSTLFGTSNSANLDINKTNSNDKTIYDVELGANSKAVAAVQRTKVRRTLLGNEKTTTTKFTINGEVNYSKKMTITTPNKDKPDPVKPTDESGSASVDQPEYLSANATNPFTGDSIVKDFIVLIISITSLLGLKITRDSMKYN